MVVRIWSIKMLIGTRSRLILYSWYSAIFDVSDYESDPLIGK